MDLAGKASRYPGDISVARGTVWRACPEGERAARHWEGLGRHCQQRSRPEGGGVMVFMPRYIGVLYRLTERLMAHRLKEVKVLHLRS